MPFSGGSSGGGGGGAWGSITGTLTNQTDLNAVITDQYNHYKGNLGNWFKPKSSPDKPLLGKIIAVVGDSTSDELATAQGLYNEFHYWQGPGNLLEGTAQTQWVQISPSAVPTSGAFNLGVYDSAGGHNVSIAYNATASAIQTSIRALGGNLGSITCSGSALPAGRIQINFGLGANANTPMSVCNIGTSTLNNGATAFVNGVYGAGSSGLGADGWNAGGGVSGRNPSDIYTLNPDLVIYSLGINNVRVGDTTEDMLVNYVTTAIQGLRTNCPNTDIVLRMPNSLTDAITPVYIITDTSTAVHGSTPLDGATQYQANVAFYSRILRNAYRRVAQLYPNVVLWDSQAELFPPFFIGHANNGVMADEVHPLVFADITKLIVPIISWKEPFKQSLATAARGANAAAPYSIYSAEVDDPNYYDLMFDGRIDTIGSGTIDFGASSYPKGKYRYTEFDTIHWDIIRVADQTPNFNGVGGWSANGDSARISSITVPTAMQMPQARIQVYRSKFNWDSNIETYWNDNNTYPYRWRGWVSGGSFGVGTISGLPGELLGKFRTKTDVTCTLIIKGQSPIVLTGATFAPSGNDLQITASIAFNSFGGFPVAILGNVLFEDGSSQRQTSISKPWLQTN